MANLQAGVVEPGDFRSVVLEGDSAKNGRHVVVGDRGPLKQVTAREAGGGEEAAVVSGHSSGLVTGADHANERAEPVPAPGGPAAERAAARPRVVSQLPGAVRSIGGRADGQVAAGLGMQQKHEAEYEREGRFLDLL